MKLLRPILKYFLILLLLLFAAGYLFVQHLKPEYSGTRTLAGITDSVRVDFDAYGIPHIFAGSEPDAMRALGYVHAQDRLWQMELIRRVGRGGLSEVFGSRTLETDRFFLTLGIDDSSREIVAGLDKSLPARQLAEAYLEGVNDFIEQGPTPPEYYLVGLDKSPFTLVDVYNTIGYMAFSFAMAHKTDPFLTGVAEKLGPDYLRDLLAEPESPTTRIPVYDVRDTSESLAFSAGADIRRILEPLPLPMLEGSNSWVIGGAKTRSGKVLFANDPHIGFAQPSVWYEAHISLADYEKYGYHMAGIPFPLLGHNRQVAYGLTMFENDDIDFYQETTDLSDSTRYQRGEEWVRFEKVEKEIRVKGGKPVHFSFLRSDLGPVVNEVIPALSNRPPVSMNWTYTKGPNRVLEALYGISHASDPESFEEAVKLIHAPGLNVMYGDAQGNIGWWAAARLYQLPDSVNTSTLIDGREAVPGFSREAGFDANPKSINPPWGYVYSANNQPDSTSIGLIPGYYLPENRAMRIESLLESRDDWDAAGVRDMIQDVQSPVVATVIADLSRLLDIRSLDDDQTECVDALNRWSADFSVESQEALLYHRWVYHLLRRTFSDELGEEGFNSLLGTHLVKKLVAKMASLEHSVWWDDISTPDTVETKSEIVSKAFKEAMASVREDFGTDSDNWRWGPVHQLEFGHALGSVPSLGWFLNVGPFEVPGTREVINNLAFNYDSSGRYPVTSGPSTRRVIDFSDIGNSMSILPTGQSGNPFSPHYDDQAELYTRGEFRPMLLDPEAIAGDAKNTLILLPK
ncbi:penicillin acylase family protein [Robiginitalea sp. SC105]|uniref:penicillin acylase family protein n=1 Tax=Robiginitalea sp. SC105 TaxID=2762332 RepID=UPI00163B2416|nr:penicillin acylase family protein [Robiginitalea sp. SC105]MBC2840439.1 penicillin acylase family protein [Robiginitalea sp. SC105]